MVRTRLLINSYSVPLPDELETLDLPSTEPLSAYSPCRVSQEPANADHRMCEAEVFYQNRDHERVEKTEMPDKAATPGRLISFPA